MDIWGEPELEHIDGSEIAACVDLAAIGTDNIYRPIMLVQDDNMVVLTIEDSERLLNFLTDAVSYIKQTKKISLQ